MGKVYLIKGISGKSKWINDNLSCRKTMIFIDEKIQQKSIFPYFPYVEYSDQHDLLKLLVEMKYHWHGETIENLVIYSNMVEDRYFYSLVEEIAQQLQKNVYITIQTNDITIEEYKE